MAPWAQAACGLLRLPNSRKAAAEALARQGKRSVLECSSLACLLQRVPVACDFPVMLVQGARKQRMSFRVSPGSDKVEVIRLGRLHCGAQRMNPWICYRSRWQSVVQIRVIGRVVGKIALVERAPPAALELQSVDHGRVGHQRHLLLESVLEYAGHEGPLRVHSRLPLHQRSYRNHLVHRSEERRVGK